MTKKKIEQKQKIDWRIALCAIICLTGLELAAMHYGINGTIRTIIFTMIALIVGITIPTDILNAVIKK